MIKVCKAKTFERWSKIGKAFWYTWNLSFFASIIHLFLIILNGVDLTLWLNLHLTNAVFSGMFMWMAEDNVISKIKEKQKLFGWDESRSQKFGKGITE